MNSKVAASICEPFVRQGRGCSSSTSKCPRFFTSHEAMQLDLEAVPKRFKFRAIRI